MHVLGLFQMWQEFQQKFETATKFQRINLAPLSLTVFDNMLRKFELRCFVHILILPRSSEINTLIRRLSTHNFFNQKPTFLQSQTVPLGFDRSPSPLPTSKSLSFQGRHHIYQYSTPTKKNALQAYIFLIASVMVSSMFTFLGGFRFLDLSQLHQSLRAKQIEVSYLRFGHLATSWYRYQTGT